MLRYVSLADRAAREGEPPKRAIAVIYLVFSVLRSDARALSGYLRRRSGPSLADGFDTDVFRVDAPNVASEYERLRARGHQLREVKATLEGIAANLRLEMRRAFERDFASLDSNPSYDDVRAAVKRAASNLRPALQNAVMFLGRTLGTRLDATGVFDDASARRELSGRLRRDVWMFAQIIRAFYTKARGSSGDGHEGWGVSPLAFVREFTAYFRAMGYPLLREADYPRVEAFVSAMASLRDTDLLDPEQLRTAVAEAEHFHNFLSELFDGISRRDELAEIPFDRKEAAASLRLYLGEWRSVGSPDATAVIGSNT